MPNGTEKFDSQNKRLIKCFRLKFCCYTSTHRFQLKKKKKRNVTFDQIRSIKGTYTHISVVILRVPNK